MSSLRPEVVPAGAADIEDAVAVHRAAFPESVLTRLGPTVLRRYYEWILEGPHQVTGLIAREAGDAAVGVIVGGVFNGSTIGFLRRERATLALALARRPWLLLSRMVLSRIGLALSLLVRMRRHIGPERPSRVPEQSFGILVVAVDPRAQGQGVGVALVDEIAQRARDAGFVRMHLTARRSGSTSEGFYRAHGWERVPQPGATWDGLMVRELDGIPRGPESVDG